MFTGMEQRDTSDGGTACVSLIWPFLTLAQRSGMGDRAPFVCQQLDLTPEQLADPTTRVPSAELVRLFNAAIVRSQQRDIGLLAARFVDRAHLGIMEDLTRSRPTLRAALETGVRYVPLVGDSVSYRMEVANGVLTSHVEFDPALPRLHEAAVEFVVATGLLWARRATGVEDLAPREVHFEHPRPEDTSRHSKLFGCPLHFGAQGTKVVMSTRALERALRGGEPVLAGLLQQHADQMLEAVSNARGVVARVRRFLEGRKDFRGVDAARVAQHLGLGARTLARRLRAEGTSYQALFDQARQQAAVRQLRETDRSAAEIAHILGFASPQGFQRAFRRWTGTSTARYRRGARVAGA